MKIIYHPMGKAGEYADYALNLYSGCSHGCLYCYVPTCMHKTKEQFANPGPRKDLLKNLEADLKYLSSCSEKTKSVFLCFSCDPYQPIEEKYQLTRQAIQMLHTAGINVMLLTKGGKRALRDLDLLTPKDQFGATLTCSSDDESLKWEPNAARPQNRMAALREAHYNGITTWVSLEPVLNPETALAIILDTCSSVDMYKVGILNYHPLTQTIDWSKFGREVVELLHSLGKTFYIKKDLQAYIDLKVKS